MSAGQRRKPSGAQTSSKKPASRPRHKTKNADVDDDAVDEDEDGEDNYDKDGNDPVEDDEEEVNNNEDNDDQENHEEEEANAEGANAAKSNDDEEEEEEEDPYKQAETKMLLAKTKILLIEQKKEKDGGLRRRDARSEQRLISEVQELRDWLAGETRKQEVASDEKKKAVRNKKAKPDPNKLWAIHGIIKETTYHYLVVWRGEDEHGQPWDDSWVAKGEVNASAMYDWAALRREVASHKKKKREEWEAWEEARKKAEDLRRASSRVQGRAESEDEHEDGDEDEDEDGDVGDDEDVDEDEDGDEDE